MAELRLKVIADDQASRLLTQVSGRLKASGKAGEKFGKQVQSGARKVDRSLEKVEKQAKQTGGAFKNLGSVIGGVFAGVTAAATLGFLKESLDLLSTQQQAVNDLSLAMKNLGVFTEEAVKEQTDFAASLQEITTLGDETIITTQALLTSFGLSGEELKRTTKAVIDLSVAQKTDLVASALLLGKAFVGETGSLSRYGIILDKNTPKTEKFAEVLDIVNKRFGGAAAAQVDTFTGKTTKLGNAFGDLRENIGEFIEVPANEFVKFLNTSVSLVAKVVTAMNSLDQTSVKAGDSIKEKTVRALQDQAISIRASISGLESLITKLQERASAQRLSTTSVIEARKENLLAAKESLDKINERIKAESKLAAVEVSKRNAEKVSNEAKEKADAEELNRKNKLAEGEKKRAQALEDFNALDRTLRIERLEATGQEIEAERERIDLELNEKISALRIAAEESKQIDDEQLQAAIGNAQAIADARTNALKKTSVAMENVKRVAGLVADDIETNFANAFADVVLEAKSFAEVTQAFFKTTARIAIQELARIAVRAALTRAALSFLGPGGSAFGAATGGLPGFAHGTQRVPGPVGQPQLAVVHGGEQISQSGGGGGGGGGGPTIIQNITQNIQVATLDADGRETILTDLAQSFRDGGDGARQFASESALAAERNAGNST